MTFVWKEGDPFPKDTGLEDTVTVAAWNRALTDKEIKSITTRGKWLASISDGLTLLVVRPTE